MSHEQFNRDGEYLLGMTYAPQFTLPADLLQGYQYAVCVLDRVGNEYDPVILGDALDPLPSPVLLAPDANASFYNPFDFRWQAVEGATSYVVEIAQDMSFDLIKERITVTDTVLSSAQMTQLASGETQYWRVLACGEGYTNGVSERRAFVPQLLVITSPHDGQIGLSTAPNITWNAPDGSTIGTVTIASDAEMTQMVYTAQGIGSIGVPTGTLNPGSKYYVTATLTYNGLDQTSPVVAFTTQFDVPSFVCPTDGGILYSDDYIVLQRQSEAVSYTYEVSNSATTWGRNRLIETLNDGSCQSTKPAGELKVNNKLMEDGTTYYARAKLTYLDEENVRRTTDYCPVISFIYKNQPHPQGVTGDVTGDGTVDISDVNAVINMMLGKTEQTVAGDVTGDGTVDISDVNAVINIMLGKS